MKALRGFTLIELMVTLGLLTILSVIAVPAYQDFTASNRAVTEINTFSGDLQFARMAAIQNGTDVTMCVSTDEKTCDGADAWNEGWIVFMDTNGNGTVDPGENLLRVHGPLASADQLTGTSDSVTFNRFGMLALYDNTQTVTLHAVPDRIAFRHCVMVSAVGSLASGSGSACP